jgi:hypothetical protein
MVVTVEEVIEARLLLQEVRCGRFGRFLLERQVNAFVARSVRDDRA